MVRVSFSSTRAARCCSAAMAGMTSADSLILPPSVKGPGVGHGNVYSHDPGDECRQRVKRLKVIVDATDVEDVKKCSIVEELVGVWEFTDKFRYLADPIRWGKTWVESSADPQGSDMTFQSIAKELQLLQTVTSPASPPNADSAQETKADAELEKTRIIEFNRAAALRARELKRQLANDAKVFEAQQWLP